GHTPLLPLRLLRARARTGANLIMVCVGTAIFGMLFFLTVFMQTVWGYSALKTGLAYLPLSAAIMVSSGAAAQLVPRIGARPLLLAGSPAVAGGMYWLSRLGEHGSYAGAVLGAMLVMAAGLGLLCPWVSREAGLGDQPELAGAGDGLGAVGRAELDVQVGDVFLDGGEGDHKIVGDPLAGCAGGELVQHLHFAGG